jgi:regulator of protease activity HflC (stomatin/prohibitin superfamily)
MSIEESTLGVSERFGKFQSIEQPGCLCFPVGIVKVKTISVRTRQLHVVVESTTNDKVFVTINIEVQFRVDKQRVYEAFYSLEDVDGQIKAYIMDSVRDKVPDKDLDKLMKKKHKLAVLIQEELTKEMSQFGYEIVKVLILEIEPGKEVKAAMNDINTAERQRAAAIAKAEANKIVKIKEAEADAEARELAGKGLAAARRAIVNGLQETVHEFAENINGVDPQTVMQLILTTQYYDTLKEIGAHSRSNAIFLPPKDFQQPTCDALFANSAIEDDQPLLTKSRTN